jgi:hypothetical protein
VDLGDNPILVKHARDARLPGLVRTLWDEGARGPAQIAGALFVDDPTILLPGESAADFIGSIAVLVRQLQERAAAVADQLAALGNLGPARR